MTRTATECANCAEEGFVKIIGVEFEDCGRRFYMAPGLGRQFQEPHLRTFPSDESIRGIHFHFRATIHEVHFADSICTGDIASSGPVEFRAGTWFTEKPGSNRRSRSHSFDRASTGGNPARTA